MQNKISALLAYQLPAFVREDHELFVAFVKAYYEWMEEEGNALYFLERFESNLDVDLADSEYVDQFVQEMAAMFPKGALIPTQDLLKIIKEFYIAKGSEQSFKFLFTILYDAEITIQHPQEFLHRSSSGKYLSNDYAYITGDNEFKVADILAGSPENIAAQIEGTVSGAKAVIDTIVSTFILNQKVLKLDISSYQGKFTPNEEVILSVNNTDVKETIFGLINEIEIVDGGTNYNLTDEVTITSVGDGQRAKAKIKRLDKGPIDEVTILDGGTGYEVGDQVKAAKLIDSAGYGFAAQVYSVDGSGAITAVQIVNGGYDYSKQTNGLIISTAGSGAVLKLNGDRIGKILDMEVFDSGIDYSDVNDITISITSDNGINADLTPVLRGVFNEPKIYQNQDDFLSNYSRIQDSYYYQNFSYVIQSKVSPHEWLGTIKRVAHPAGMQLFGSLLIESEFDISIMLAPDFTRSLSIIIQLFTEYDVTDQPAYEQDYLTLIRENFDACGIDLTLGDLENMKFLDTFNWTIGEFQDNTINDVVTPCQQPMEFMENSEITIT